MEFGSVQFFKRLIVIIVILVMLGLTAGCAVLAWKNEALRGRLSVTEAAVSNASKSDAFSAYALSDENDAEPLPYQTMYPELYVSDRPLSFAEEEGKVAYLTFDDGPSEVTGEVLDILAAYNIKATFFTVYKEGENMEALYRRIADEGHTIAVHSATHDYRQVYASVDAYLADFAVQSEHIEEITGVHPEIFRFPGGSLNAYNQLIYREIIAEMTRRGYVYYDWNVSSGDAQQHYTTDSMLGNIVAGTAKRDKMIILLHDSATKTNLPDILPSIIDALTERGYRFERLTNTVRPVQFGYLS